MNCKEILDLACTELLKLRNNEFDIFSITKPSSIQFAKNLANVLSKISPFLGNLIEFHAADILNTKKYGDGQWIKQDPGFPDLLYTGTISPKPGIELKTWYPLATEITARFKESILHFNEDQTRLALIVWMPQYIIYGKPKIIDVWVGSAKEVAMARDNHYHNPPDYIIFEPEDTSERTRNLQQTNTNGYKFQGSIDQLEKAEEEVRKWGSDGVKYSPSNDYQLKLKSLLQKYPYRLDTNFSKIDRICHDGIETFKRKVLETRILKHTISQWTTLISENEEKIKQLLEEIV